MADKKSGRRVSAVGRLVTKEDKEAARILLELDQKNDRVIFGLPQSE